MSSANYIIRYTHHSAHGIAIFMMHLCVPKIMRIQPECPHGLRVRLYAHFSDHFIVRIQSCMRIFQDACTPVCVRWVRMQSYMRTWKCAHNMYAHTCTATCVNRMRIQGCMRAFNFLYAHNNSPVCAPTVRIQDCIRARTLLYYPINCSRDGRDL